MKFSKRFANGLNWDYCFFKFYDLRSFILSHKMRSKCQHHEEKKNGFSKVNPQLFIRDGLIFIDFSLPQICLYGKCISKFRIVPEIAVCSLGCSSQ